MPLPRFAPILIGLFSIVLFARISEAQVTTVTDTTSTPIEGAGHDYIHLLSETVNPANGSVSLRINLPMPKGRGITIPFSFAYDSNSVNHLEGEIPIPGYAEWLSNTDTFAQGGWSYVYPELRANQWTVEVPEISGYNDGQPIYTYYPCNYESNYLFRDASGSNHSLLNLGAEWSSNPPPGGCSAGYSAGPANVDPLVTGSLTLNAGGNYQALPAYIYDSSGTVYYFSALPGGPFPDGYQDMYSGVPSYIEDRNGNRATATQSGTTLSFTDTVGRTAISVNAFGPSGATNTVTAGGLSYQVTWETVTASYTVPATNFPQSGSDCVWPSNVSISEVVISKITLPNGQAYQFYYGENNPNANFRNPYGLLSEIIYPSGGWVAYTWQFSSNANESADFAGSAEGTSSPPIVDGCQYEYESPVVATREVGFGGSNPSQTQSFAYITTWSASNPTQWTQKTASVTTTDNVLNESALTKYTYSPFSLTTPPFEPTQNLPQTPLESSIQYYNWGNTSTPLRTVSKTWFDPAHLETQQTILNDYNNITSQVTYCYTVTACTPGIFMQTHEVDEYDFGNSTSPIRGTVTNYQSFTGTPGEIGNAPCQTVTYAGSGTNGTRVAETDYYYDGATALCGTISSAAATGGPSGFTGRYDETLFGPSATTPRGNLTKLTKLCIQSAPACTSGNPSATFTYDETGQIPASKDPDGNTTQYFYADSYTTLSNGQNASYTPSGSTNAYLTKITNPLGQNEKFSYDYNNGQLTVSQDQNDINASRTGTTYLYNDPFNRPTRVTYPDGGLTSIAYNDSPYNPSTPSPSVTTTKAITSSTNLVTVVATDGLGHVVETLLTSDPDCASGDATNTAYDGEGHVHTRTNPYCTTSDPTYGTTTFTPDALGRTIQVINPDNSTILTTYIGRATQVQDEGNGNGTEHVTRVSQTDALGRLNSICEVSSSSLLGQNGSPAACGQDISATGFLTTYQYDVLANLLQVTQSTMASRSFAYDSLSRLTSSVNPESNTQPVSPYTVVPTTYTYDANGNLSTKTGPLQNKTGTATVTTSYQYDALSRMTQKSYNDGATPTATFVYDSTSWGSLTNAIGRLVESTTTAHLGYMATYTEYDPMGRVSEQFQYTPMSGQNEYRMPYTYDLMGNMTAFSDGYFVSWYPAYNGAGRLLSLTAGTYELPSPYNLLSGAHYNAAGQITSDSLATGETETFAYTKRLQLQSDTATVSPTTVYSYGLTFAPNGNVTAANDNVNGNWNYQYDQFNRLICSNLASNGTCASPTNGTQTYSYAYDRFGNRWQQNGPYTFTASFTGNNTANNNRMDTYSYDSAGNLLYDGTHYYFYDAENHLIQVDGTLGYCTAGTGTAATACYVYDAEGHRVHRTGVVTDTCDATGKRDYAFDLAGNWVGEYNSSGTGCISEIYAGSRHIVTYAGGTPLFIHSDWLGTVRRRNSATYPTYNFESCTSLPFGDGLACTGGDLSTLHFTGKERDRESGLDDFLARHYTSNMGHFMSPDWSATAEPVPYAKLDNPQSLNLYSYVKNNPMTFEDPDGHDGVMDTILQLAGGSLSNPGPAMKNLIVGGAKGLINLTISAGNAVSSAVGLNVDGGGASQTPELPLNNEGESIGAQASTSLLFGVVGGAMGEAAGSGAAETLATPVPKEGIYEGPDATDPGKTYVGQSGNIPERLAQHGESGTGKFPEGTEVSTTEVKGGKTAREIAEQKRIDQLGGVKSKPGSQTSNVRNPIGPKRKDLVNNQ